MISERNKNLLLNNLKQIPIIELACSKSSVSRATFYRHKKQDKEFAKLVDEALAEGEGFINDMSESQLIALIKSKNFQAIQLWLRHHHPKYSQKLEVSGNINIKEEPLSAEQEELVKKSLKLAGLLPSEKDPQNNGEQRTGGNPEQGS